MSVIGIICEFNPFHNGHKYLIDSVKKDGDTVVCVMSGNFVQRGEPAVIPKEVRTEAALLNGADIVLELPFVYATASAELFAQSAVKMLNDFGCDKIAFGTENADETLLENAVDVLLSDNFQKEVLNELQNGVSYPTARQTVFNKYNSETDISTPNNILAIEYIKAIRNLNSDMAPIVIKRKGAGYNENTAIENFASATYIRNLINDNENYGDYIPENLIELYSDTINNGMIVSKEKYNIAALSVLRNSLNGNLSNIANVSEGLENRIAEAIKSNVELNDVYDNAKTKRYTHSRIRRAVLSMIMGINADDLKIQVPYCRLLGFNSKCGTVMGELVKNAKMPFVASYSDVVRLSNDEANRIFEIENKSTDFYNLILQNSLNCSTEMKFMPIKL